MKGSSNRKQSFVETVARSKERKKIQIHTNIQFLYFVKIAEFLYHTFESYHFRMIV